jgi:glycosyltransferase involved in cell wall biosynthesis
MLAVQLLIRNSDDPAKKNSKFCFSQKLLKRRPFRSYILLFLRILKIFRYVKLLFLHTTKVFDLLFAQFRFATILFSIKPFSVKPLRKASGRTPIILIIANSYGNSEPRLLRECALAREYGAEPFVLCLPCPDSHSSPNYLFTRIPLSLTYNNNYPSLTRLWSLFYDFFFSPVLKSFFHKFSFYIKIHQYFTIVRFLSTNLFLDFTVAASRIKWLLKAYDVKCIIAHDYYTYPAGILARSILDVPLIYDVHEHAFSQLSDDAFKNKTVPYLYQLHRYAFKRVDFIGVVSQGILDALVRDFPCLSQRARLLRNLPHLPIQSVSFDLRSTPQLNPSKISVLYSGLITSGRGLESLIKAVPLFDTRFDLYIIGPSCSDTQQIMINYQTLPPAQQERINFLDPVPFSELISFCSLFDIGYLVQPLYGPQKDFSLANKFFEYIHAGMCLCVDSSREMSSIINQFNLGFTVEDDTPESIARSLNSISIEDLNYYKGNSVSASSSLQFSSDTKWLQSLIVN